MKNYYQILNVNKDASLKEIGKSYKQLALKFHPDVNKESYAKQMFISILEAYEVLKNPVRRRRYDYLLSLKQLSNEKQQTHSKKTKKWENSIRRKQEQSNAKANRYADKSEKVFRKSSGWSDFIHSCFEILDFFIRLLNIFS